MRPELHPVIHHLDNDTTLRNAEVCVQAGCAGVFLIQMEGQDAHLDWAYRAVKAKFPSLRVGINRLATEPIESLRLNGALGASSTWLDNCGVTSAGADARGQILSIRLAPLKERHALFGSVAFKYRLQERDPAGAAVMAARLGFIPTTSGGATGEAPSVSKVAAMSEALKGGPLALASGVDAGNAREFLPYVTHFLVSTGISKTFHEFDAKKVAELNRIITSD